MRSGKLGDAERRVAVRDRREGRRRSARAESGKDLAAKIIVPFCPESKLSGSRAYTSFMKNVWYRRDFRSSGGMKGKRVRLHFGARGLPGVGLGQRPTGGLARRRQRGVHLRHHAVAARRRQRTGGSRVRRHRQRQPAHRQADAHRQRRLRLHPHHRHLAAGVAGSGRLVLCGEFLHRSGSRPFAGADRGRGQRRGIRI